ncbi:MAG: STAS domain-containing protein [Leptospiraceae bacterium]|nr:STAS domain-containing protein [Leptospiraceae bacterium]MCP5496112.1 STAS domain-containing protein [Leptospiraceae bacterium]
MLESKIEIDNDICIIHLDGSISLKNAIQLKELIINQANNGYVNIILDFGDNVYIDSSGIGAIFNSQKYVNEKNGTLKIKNISHEIMTILKIANLDKHLNIIP